MLLSRLTEQTYGHYASARTMESVGRDGEPLPWYTYPAIQWLSQLRFDGINVLEFGSGNSTRWWASKAASVLAIEDDPVWHAKIAPALPANVEYRLVRGGPAEYSAVATGRTYGVVVIDGSHRYDCARAAIGAVEEGGMVLLDNSDWHPDTAGLLRGAGLTQVDFIGPGPINPYSWATSTVLGPGNMRIPRAREVSVIGGVAQRSASDRPSERLQQ